MKKLYYSEYSCMVPHMGVIIDDIILSSKKGDSVYWAYCDHALSSCWLNNKGNTHLCNFCQSIYRSYRRKYSQYAHFIPINKSDFIHSEIPVSITSPTEVRSFCYRTVKVGMSILSSYYSATRDLDIKNWEEFKSYCSPLIKEICDFIDFVYQIIPKLQPDKIILFNGRNFSNRLFYDIALQMNIPFASLEVIGGHGEPFKKVVFEGDLPHSIKLNTNLIRSLWDKSPQSLDEKSTLASSFYERRRHGDLVADVKIYIGAQIEGLLPSDYNPNNRNIAIFNSSADELAAIGGEFDENLLFKSQYEAIKYILEHSPSQIHYYLRIHPNLKGITHSAHMDLYKLSEFDNITIIGPDESVSTYTLLDSCEKVVTFGSTMGVEACYWGKPSILLGHSLYENLSVCYYPNSTQELMSLILNKELAPKPNMGALKYGYYLLDREYRGEETTTDINIIHKYLFNKRWHYEMTSCMKPFWIYALKYLFYVQIPQRLFPLKSNHYPV